MSLRSIIMVQMYQNQIRVKAMRDEIYLQESDQIKYNS